MKRERERRSNLRLAISWYWWNIISSKEEDDIPYHEIHPQQKNDEYIIIYKWRLRETQTNMRLAITWYQWNDISPKEEDDISYYDIHQKKN